MDAHCQAHEGMNTSVSICINDRTYCLHTKLYKKQSVIHNLVREYMFKSYKKVAVVDKTHRSDTTASCSDDARSGIKHTTPTLSS